MTAFEITCIRVTNDSPFETEEYTETVTTQAVAVSNGPDRYTASSPLWGSTKGSYGDARTAAIDLAISKSAAVRNVAEIIPVQPAPEPTKAETFAELRSTLMHAVIDLETCSTDDEIFAWPYGLAVAFAENGKPYAASLDKAATADDVHGTVRNGSGVAAVRTRRLEACKAQARELRRLIAVAAAKYHPSLTNDPAEAKRYPDTTAAYFLAGRAFEADTTLPPTFGWSVIPHPAGGEGFAAEAFGAYVRA